LASGYFQANREAPIFPELKGLFAKTAGLAFAGQKVGVRQVSEGFWLVTFMKCDLGYFYDETCRLEPIENPFGPKVLPMSSE
jgi:hypothetical protein